MSKLEGLQVSQWGQKQLYIRVFSLMCVLFWARGSVALAQAPYAEPGFVQYSFPDHLPSSEVYQVRCDRSGRLWIATDQGVVRFDGMEFKTFSQEEGLEDPTVFCMTEDDSGTMWFATLSGKVFAHRNGRIHPHPRNEELDSLIRFQNIYSLGVRNDSVWVGASSLRSFILPPAGPVEFNSTAASQYTLFHTMLGAQEVFGRISTRVEDEHTAIVLKRGASQVDTLWLEYRIREAPKLSIKALTDGTYLISNTHQLISVDPEKKVVAPVSEAQGRFSSSSIYEDAQGYRWVGTMQNGVYKLDTRNLVVGHYLRGFSVTSITSDPEGGVWFSTLESGVFYAPSPEVMHWQREAFGMAGKLTAYALYGDTLYLGSQKGEFTELNIHSLRAGVGISILHEQQLSEITNFSRNVAGFVSTAKGIYAREHGGTSTWEERARINGEVFTFEGRTLVLGNRLYRLHPGELTFDTLVNDIPCRVKDVLIDPQGTLWMSCVDAVRVADSPYASDRSRVVLPHRANAWYLSGDTLWVGTIHAGLHAFRMSTQEALPLNLPADSVGERITALRVIGTQLWIASEKGLIRASLKSGVPQIELRSNHTDGIPQYRVLGMEEVGDTLVLIGEQGISFFARSTSLQNRQPPPAYIQVFSRWESAEWEPTTATELTHKQNNVRFDVGGIAYRNAQAITFRYRLIGLDTQFRTTRDPRIMYSALSPGTYRFEVMAGNNQGVWSLTPTTYTFNVLPPFWRTGWFTGLGILTVLLAVSAGIWIRVRTFERKRSLQLRLLESEQRSLQVQMNPHFLYNSLNAAQYQITAGDRAKAADHLARFSLLMRNVLENNRTSFITLKKELEMVELYLKLEKTRLLDAFTYRIKVVDPELWEAEVPTMLIQPFVENAVWHGLTGRTEGGEVSVSVYPTETGLECCIRDNGIGRKQAAALRKQKHKSSGIAMIRQRLSILNEKRGERSYALHIEDASDDPVFPGTQVILKLPRHAD